MSLKSLISFRSVASLSKSQMLLAGVGITGISGGLILVKDVDFIQATTTTLNNVIIDPVKVYLYQPFESFANSVRHGIFVMSDNLFKWLDLDSDKSFEFSLTKEGIVGLPKMVVDGSQKVFVAAKSLTVSFFRFLFFDLPKFISEHGVNGAQDYINHYLRSVNGLFSRPVDGRLRSMKTRMDQFVDCLKTPGFFDSLASVNKFFILFKDKIEKLSDEQMAEVIDVYLDDPIEMKVKVEAIFSNLDIEKDKAVIDRFDSDLMMDFVRGENIEKLKAALAAAKISERIANISESLARIFAPSRVHEARSETSKAAGEELGRVFIGAVSWWNGWAG